MQWVCVNRHYLIKNLFFQEQYVLITQTHCMYTENWDVILIDSLIHGFRIGCHIITNFPTTGGNTVVYPAVSGIVQSKLPVFKYKGMKQPTIIKVLHLSSMCLFGPANLLIPILQNPIPLISTTTDDFLLHAQIWCSGLIVCGMGANVYYPAQIVHKPFPISKDMQLFEQALIITIMKGVLPCGTGNIAIRFFHRFPRNRQLPNFLKFIGISSKYTSGRAKLGMVDQRDPIEIVCKYGSRSNYELVKSEISY